jgi:5-methylcytosine-specific restriction enzyme A
LKPLRKSSVMDLLAEAGFDVSDWYNVKGQPPSRNPKYCYNWSFEQPGEAIAVCLWHRSLAMRDGRVAYRRKPSSRASRRREPGSNLWNQRNDDFGARLELAYRQQLPVRVILIEGKERNPADPKPKASKVEARVLNEESWAVTEYDYSTGEAWLVRGERPMAPAVDASDLETSWFEGTRKLAFVYHRQREARARREKIRKR